MPTKHKAGLKIIEIKLGNIPQRNLKNRDSMYKMANLMGKKLNEKSRECHSHKPQPTLDSRRKRKRQNTTVCKINKQMHENHIDQPSLLQAR